MVAPSAAAQPASSLAERTVEFAVEMSCSNCVKSVQASLGRVAGVRSVVVDLASQSATVEGSAAVDELLAALALTGFASRLVGQGSGDGFDSAFAASLGLDERTLLQSLAAVAELKGDQGGGVLGVVRFVQTSPSAGRVEASLAGLTPGPHALALHTYGDLTRGAASTGPLLEGGLLATLTAGEDGRARLDGVPLHPSLHVWDIVGRALVVHPTGEAVEGRGEGAAASVVARASLAGDNDKRTCACDGTVIFSAEDLMPKLRSKA